MAREIVEFPIAGKVVSVDVRAGDKVNEGDTLCVIESMKMENPITSPVDGTVSKIELTVGQTVNAGEPVAVIEY